MQPLYQRVVTPGGALLSRSAFDSPSLLRRLGNEEHRRDSSAAELRSRNRRWTSRSCSATGSQSPVAVVIGAQARYSIARECKLVLFPR